MAKRDKILEKANQLLSSADAKVDFIEAGQNILLNNLPTYAAKAKKINPQGFSNLTLVEDKDPSLTVSKIYSKGSRAREYVDFGGIPALRSTLNPYFKLYKIVRNNSGKAEKVLRIPLLGEELKNNILTPGVLDAAYKSVGLMNINWDLKDQTAFGSGRLVEVQIQLKFSDPSVIGHDFPTIDIMKDSLEPDQTFQYVDLIRRANGRRPISRIVSGDQYETYSLRLDIGYTPPSKNVIEGLASRDLSTDFISDVANAAVEVNNISLLLEMQDYDLNILENGEMELTLSYFSFMERQSETLDYDIFANFKNIITKAEVDSKIKSSPLSEKKAARISAKATLKSKIESIEREIIARNEITDAALKQRRRYGGTEPGSFARIKWLASDEAADINSRIRGTDDLKSDIRETKQSIAALDETLSDIEEEVAQERLRIQYSNKVQRYARVMEQIHKKKKIYHIEIERSKLIMYSKEYLKYVKQAYEELGKDDSAESAALFLANQRSLNASKKMKKSSIDISGLETQLEIAIATVLKTEEDKTAEEKAKIVIAEGLNKKLGAATAGKTRDKYQVHFVFLGDLIDAVMDLGDLHKKMRDDKFGVMLGNFSYIDSFNPMSNLPSAFGSFRFPTSVNFADIPVSLEYFSQFFAATIVDKGITKLQFMDFLNGVVNQLAVPALNKAVGGVATQHTVSAKTTQLLSTNRLDFGYVDSLSSQSPVEAVKTATQAGSGIKGRINLSNPQTVEAFSQALAPSYYKTMKGATEVAISNKVWSYMLVHGAQNKVLSGIGQSTDEDYANGVYHFNFGGSNSDNPRSPINGRTDITRAIQFQKVKQPGQREMMVDRYMNQEGDDRNLELWNVFNANVTMDGNNLFAPGKIIAIKPAVGVMGENGRNISAELGLGGYYLITGVSSTYDSGGEWETKIEAAWQSGLTTNPTTNVVRSPGQKISTDEILAIIPENPNQSTDQSLAGKEDLEP